MTFQRKRRFPRNSVNILTFTALAFLHHSTHNGQKRNANTGQSRQCSTLTHSAFVTIILEDQRSASGLFALHSEPHASTLTLHSLVPVSSTSRDIPPPIAYNKPQMNWGDLPVSLGTPLACSLPARLMQMQTVPKFQPVSNHATNFQKKEQYLGYCSAKNLN